MEEVKEKQEKAGRRVQCERGREGISAREPFRRKMMKRT